MKKFLPPIRLPESGLLTLRLPAGWPEQEGKIAWWWGSGPSAAQHGQVERLSDLPAYARNARTQVWSPTADTLLTQVSIPTRSRARILQALPFALEDQVLGEPENLTFSYRSRDDGSLAVAVTARDRLATWSGALQAAELAVASVCPAVLKVPLEPGSWSLALDLEDGVLRTGQLAGMACTLSQDGSVPTELRLAVREAVGRDQAPSGLLVFNAPAGLDADAWSAELGIPVTRREQNYWAAASGAPPISLLEREFASLGGASSGLSRLRPAAIMLAVWLVAGFGFNLWEWWQLSHAQQVQRKEMLELFRRSFPEARAITDPALQMERNLAALRSGSGGATPGDLLPLLASAGSVIRATPDTRLRGVQYGEASLTLELTLKDFQAMEVMKNALAGRGLNAEVLSANSREGLVEGRMRIRAGGRT